MWGNEDVTGLPQSFILYVLQCLSNEKMYHQGKHGFYSLRLELCVFWKVQLLGGPVKMICLTLASSPAVAFLSFLHFEKSLVTRFRVERWLTLHVCARSLTLKHRCTSCYCHCAESPAADMRSRHCGFRKINT